LTGGLVARSKKLEEAQNLTKKESELRKKIETFSDILDSIKTSDAKIKTLWREVYENAVADRENANMMFTDAWQRMQSPGTTDHVTVGTTMSKYLERMCKSNEQILRLAELISKAEEENMSINSDDVFAQIGDLTERKSKK
jgi:hypothetical protein